MKITDIAYNLPEIVALSAQVILDSGSTRPVQIFGIDGKSDELISYIVKPRGNERMIDGGSLREFLGAFIAMELNLNVPNPAIIQISKEFIESTRFTPNYPLFVNSEGKNYGSKSIDGFTPFFEDVELFKKYNSDLQKIIVFDILIGTTDRRTDKPNMSLKNGNIYIYDHELSFGFLFEIPKNKEPWIISGEDFKSIRAHILYNFFSGKELNCDSFIDSFESLNESFWDKAEKLIPKSVANNHFYLIRENILDKIKHLDIYKNEIKKALL